MVFFLTSIFLANALADKNNIFVPSGGRISPLFSDNVFPFYFLFVLQLGKNLKDDVRV